MMNNFATNTFAVLLLCLRLAIGQSESDSAVVDPVTSVITADDGEMTEIFTPTAISVSGLTPPITSATTITSTNTAGEEQLIAIAAGAGIVAGAGIAAWVYKPMPGGPPAPTSPPPYSTSPQANPEDTTALSSQPTTLTTITSSSSSSQPPACPFPSDGPSVTFAQAAVQPQWVVEIPTQTTSSFHPDCTQAGENKQLLRGATPDYITTLAEVFCQGSLSADRTTTLGQDDLAGDSRWKNSRLESVRVDFGFEHKLTDDGCAQNCMDAFRQISLTCQYNSHILYGGGSLEQGCGIYSLRVDADPNTELECPPTPSPIAQDYIYRDAAIDAIDSFCGAQHGNTIVQSDDSTEIHETLFSVTYAGGCKGSGTYAIEKDTCTSYFMQTLDSCDIDSTVFKHGGTLTDTDNCGSFTMHPTGKDLTACYPENEQFISGSHAVVSPEIAQDAINQYCDRNGDGQSYTLDPTIPPQDTLVQNSCTSEGQASCGYFYTSDGDRVTKEGDVGDILVRITARYLSDAEAVNYECPPRQEYEIHGDRCHQMLGKLTGAEPEGQCAPGDQDKLDLGSFLEMGDKGCVLWNMWAVPTHS